MTYQHLRERLEKERLELLSANETTSDARKPVELDQQSVGRLSRMDAMQVQAMAKAQEGRRQTRLKLIDAALARFASGDYGYCTGCDEEIPSGRLEVDPAVPRCVNCAG